MAVASLFWLLRQKPIHQSGTTASFLRKIRYVITAAILDRLLHNAHVINIKGRSYRFRDLEQTLGARQT